MFREHHFEDVVRRGSEKVGSATASITTVGLTNPTECDAQCDTISANRIELLTRAVILVAGMNLAEDERAAVLTRAIADLTSPATRIPE
jgi:hypothetical protein